MCWMARLNNLGYDVGEVNGKIDENTRYAIKLFQRDNDLEVDGIVGPKTKAKLEKVYKF